LLPAPVVAGAWELGTVVPRTFQPPIITQPPEYAVLHDFSLFDYDGDGLMDIAALGTATGGLYLVGIKGTGDDDFNTSTIELHGVQVSGGAQGSPNFPNSSPPLVPTATPLAGDGLGSVTIGAIRTGDLNNDGFYDDMVIAGPGEGHVGITTFA